MDHGHLRRRQLRLEWARFAAQTPHYVLSNTLTSALWPRHEVRPRTRRNRGPQASARQGHLSRWRCSNYGKLIDAGLVDELRLIVYPLIAGEGKALFATTERRRGLELRKVQQLQDGRVSLIYGIG